MNVNVDTSGLTTIITAVQCVVSGITLSGVITLLNSRPSLVHDTKKNNANSSVYIDYCCVYRNNLPNRWQGYA